jgi:hypothetical protein
MTKRFCDRCLKDLPSAPADTTTFMLKEGDQTWRVVVSVARERDLCKPCRKEIITKGQPA